MKNISSFKNHSHYPVMLEQIIEICSPKKGGNFIDCTYGAGGFTNAILSFPKTKVSEIAPSINANPFAPPFSIRTRSPSLNSSAVS